MTKRKMTYEEILNESLIEAKKLFEEQRKNQKPVKRWARNLGSNEPAENYIRPENMSQKITDAAVKAAGDSLIK